MDIGIALVNSHPAVPFAGDGGEERICGSQTIEKIKREETLDFMRLINVVP